jgi:hypothetical protein
MAGSPLSVREEHGDASRHGSRIRLCEEHTADAIGHVARRERITLREHRDAERHEIQIPERGIIPAGGYPSELRGRQHGLLIQPLADVRHDLGDT